MFWLTGVFPSNGQTISPTFPQSGLVFYTVETVVLCLTESWIISPFPSHWIKEICDRVFHSLYQHSQLLSCSVNCNKDLQPSLASDLMTCHDLIRNIVPNLTFDVVTCHDLIIKNSTLPIPSPKEKGGRGCRVHAWSQHPMTQRPETDTAVISWINGHNTRESVWSGPAKSERMLMNRTDPSNGLGWYHAPCSSMDPQGNAEQEDKLKS